MAKKQLFFLSLIALMVSAVASFMFLQELPNQKDFMEYTQSGNMRVSFLIFVVISVFILIVSVLDSEKHPFKKICIILMSTPLTIILSLFLSILISA